MIYNEVAKRSDRQYTVTTMGPSTLPGICPGRAGQPGPACPPVQVHVSYLEIYNEVGFDLLDPDREIKAMEDLPQV